MNETTLTTPHLREAPLSRFSGSQHLVDLIDLSAQLHDEDHAGQHGHRQMTIFHHLPTTIVFFAFEEGSTMKNHRVQGTVTIHVLDGALTVEAADGGGENQWKTWDLRAGHVLILDANVMHNVTALAPSHMLLTVQLHSGVAH